MRPRPLLVASARPVRFQRGLHPIAPACFFCRSRRDGALRRPADISVFTQRHGCHPFATALSPSVLAGTTVTHVLLLPASAPTYLIYVSPSLAGRPCANGAAESSGGISPGRCARGPRVGRASRSLRTEVSISSSARA
jgi:hypothetical protein